MRKTFSAGISVVFLLVVGVFCPVSCSHPKDKNPNLQVVFAGVPIKVLQVEGISGPLRQVVFRAPSGERRVLKEGDIVAEEQFEVSSIGGAQVVLKEAGRYRPIIGEPRTIIISFDPTRAPGERQKMFTIGGSSVEKTNRPAVQQTSSRPGVPPGKLSF